MTILELTNQDLNESQKSTEKIGILSEFQTKQPGKFRMLEDRLVAPSRFGGPCPPSEFRGCQEFFRNFIRASGGHQIFLTHLKTTLAASIADICQKFFDSGASTSTSTVENSSGMTTVDEVQSWMSVGSLIYYLVCWPAWLAGIFATRVRAWQVMLSPRFGFI